MNLTRRGLLAGLGATVVVYPVLARAQAQIGAVAPVATLPEVLFDVEAAVAKAKLGGEVSFAVMDAATGAVLAERHADAMMAPASTLKVVTSLYALQKLGPDHRFVTRVLRSGDDLILAGGADPLLDTDGLARLAADTAKAWQGTPPKRFLVWGGALPRRDRIAEEQDDYLPYNPAISGMILNFNRVHLGWKAGQFMLEARGGSQSPRSYTVAVGAADRASPLFTYDGSGKKESWTMARSAMGKSGARWLPVRRPELYAGDVFQTLCRAKGLVLPTPEVQEAAPNGTEVATLSSAPLSQIIRGMLKYSTNLTAEAIGLSASGAASPQASAQQMQDWLRTILPEDHFEFHDHSGLSAQNRLTAVSLTRLLVKEGDRDGLRDLLKHIPLRDEKGQAKDSDITVLAKTGTLNFVSNLSGYAKAADGREIAFTILTGDEPRRAANEGRELPEGVRSWTRRSKIMQQAMIEGWLDGGPAQIAGPAVAAGQASVVR
ncbi:D-alanyl-D-alanine carboxypeptidase [Paracoccus sp. CPCC 101403]|uniref:D-alanyl-D-alanine carboxypeptidase n=1 Tax=Paracoccus broussonetiae TaxID=3075834 RepID=A0ABU3EGQ4_9RHOB|nr:D-alanyl-D-alanine carboxypeptidase [Paracoccus sp. CPCC 101403]MDT1063413.1 D-alanyl-D-alanine carboxypeptidase [Paracoccus sp. CPCC 101403]